MIDTKAQSIRRNIEESTGAEIALNIDKTKLQTALHIWFDDLPKRNGPVLRFGTSGLKRHSVQLSFGRFSKNLINQISVATPEAVQLSRALLKSLSNDINLAFPAGMNVDNWEIVDSEFVVTAERRSVDEPLSDAALERTCTDVVVPIMAAMAELIGYDEVIEGIKEDEAAWEGAEKISIITRRERNPRNRLLCFRVHGYQCMICDIDPRKNYGSAGSILEVHHLQPLSQLESPRAYDPNTDLLPLCPNCHRAVHTKKPVPWTPAQIREMRDIV